MLPFIILQFQLVLFMHFSVVQTLDTNQTTSSNDNSSTAEQRLLKWQSRLAEISGDPETNWTACTCDRTAGYCDVECCCDENCTQMDKYAFARCHAVVASGEAGYFCRSTRHIFDRKKFHSAHQSSRLLCVSKDNTGMKQLFANKKTITDSGKLKIKTKHYFKWAANNHSNWFTAQVDRQNARADQVKSMLEYKSGNAIIWTFTEDKAANGSTHWLDHWRLPSALNSRQGQCNHLQIVNYMHPFSSACLHQLKATCAADEQLNADTYHKAIRFHYYDFIKEEYRAVVVELEGKYGKTNYDPVKATCNNVIAAVEYTVWHKGIYGISRVSLKLRQIELSNSTQAIKQKFVVHFKWADSDVKLNLLSGNSGYTRDQRLVFAQRTSNDSYSLAEKHLIGSYRLGLCAQNREITNNLFRFGVNQFTSCRLRMEMQSITKQQLCTSLESEIAKYHDPNLSNLLVSTFGNSSGAYNNTDEWAPVLEPSSLSNAELATFGCDHLAQGASWQIFYVKVGSREQPLQLKIVGAALQRHPLSGLKTKCSRDLKCSLVLDTELFSSVDFTDVTEPLRPDYAPAPSVRIELPNDFFYPFQASSSAGIRIINSSLTVGLLAIVILQL